MRARGLGRARALVAAIVALGIGAPAVARANDPAGAQQLFDQARKLMAQEKWAEACPKLEESQRLDPAGGTLLHLALCREHEGRLATAWAHYHETLAQAKRDGRKDRAKIAQDRIDQLAPRLAKIRVRVAPSMKKAPGFTLRRDGIVVGEAQWNDAIPVDPGTRVLRAQADGRKPWSKEVEVPPKPVEITVDVPELEAEPLAKKVDPPPERPAEKPTPAWRADTNDGGSTQRTVGIVLGGVGLAGVAVGTIFGVIAITKKSEADKECQPPDRDVCTQKGIDASESSTSAGNVSTVGFIAGAALLAGGAVLYFTAPSGTSLAVHPSAGPQGAGAAVRLSF